MHTILHQYPRAKAGFLFGLFEFRYHSSSFIDIVEKKSKIIKGFFFCFFLMYCISNRRFFGILCSWFYVAVNIDPSYLRIPDAVRI